MALLWLVDRATGLLAYPALWAAVVTGVWYDARAFGVLRDAARAVHIPVAAFASLLVVAHAVVGTVDVAFVATGRSPVPAYGLQFLVAGTVVGAGALLVLAVAVLAFLDPLRAARPWSPRVVHALSYVGYAFATVHAVAVGTDVAPVGNSLVLGGVLVVVYCIAFREVARSDLVDVVDTQ